MTMAKRILVPLDGEERSEAIVPLVAAVARDAGATVRLLRVYPVPERVEARVLPAARSNEGTGASEDRRRRRERRLEPRRARRRERALVARADERARDPHGEPTEEIAKEAESFAADVIALTEPARSRLRRLVNPGLAERVARETSVPMLVLKTVA